METDLSFTITIKTSRIYTQTRCHTTIPYIYTLTHFFFSFSTFEYLKGKRLSRCFFEEKKRGGICFFSLLTGWKHSFTSLSHHYCILLSVLYSYDISLSMRMSTVRVLYKVMKKKMLSFSRCLFLSSHKMKCVWEDFHTENVSVEITTVDSLCIVYALYSFGISIRSVLARIKYFRLGIWQAFGKKRCFVATNIRENRPCVLSIELQSEDRRHPETSASIESGILHSLPELALYK